MKKDFSKWHEEKSRINALESNSFFKQREIWWCYLGKNIGNEQDGERESFLRPIIIIKKFNLNAFLAVPLTSQTRKGEYYFELGVLNNTSNTAILSQIRFMDRKRLRRKITTLPKETFKILIRRIIEVCFTG